MVAFRRRLPPEEVKALKFKVPGGVATTIGGLIFLLFIIGLIGYHPDTRISLYVGFAWIVVLLIGWMFKRRHDRSLDVGFALIVVLLIGLMFKRRHDRQLAENQ